MARWAGAATAVGYLASTFGAEHDEAAVIAELRSGSEEAYSWLIAHFHQPVYSLVYRILNDPTDAADTTQEVFIKVFRHIQRFNGDSSLKTWIYRIAVHEASNQRRWWFRHKRQEASMSAPTDPGNEESLCLEDTLVDTGESPFEHCAHEQVRAKVEEELRNVPEPYRTAVVLRDIEGLSYEEMAEVLNVTLGTVKSRLMRGREALRQKLVPYIEQVGDELGISPTAKKKKARSVGPMIEVEAKR
jgi:RNA polymerase sigma-70 factor (ECF subfamily)